MLTSVVLILVLGYLAGQIALRCRFPPLMGMIAVGISLGPEGGQILSPSVLSAAADLRVVAVMIILMRAGLGLDREKLAQQGSVALRLGVLPATFEALVTMGLASLIFDLNLLTALLLGCVLSPESPAVIVPGMLRLKSLGWGVAKGIPDAILTGSALSDVWILLVFSLLLNIIVEDRVDPLILPGGLTVSRLQFLPIQLGLQLSLGVLAGYLGAQVLVKLQSQWMQTRVQETVLTASLTLALVIGSESYPYYSGYLAAMSLGSFLIELDPPLARRLRHSFHQLWVVAEIVLFVLMGATIQFSVLASIWVPGLGVLILGTLVGRMLGWSLATLGSNWTWKERLFLLPANSAKATVQAAIGAIPLSVGIESGDLILAMSALAILVTAPLGAWGIPVLAPTLLERGEIDPTKVTIEAPILLLAAVDTSNLASAVLTQVAHLARRSEATVIVLHVMQESQLESPDRLVVLQQSIRVKLADIHHQFLQEPLVRSVPETILQVADQHRVAAIVMGKRGHGSDQGVGSVSQAVVVASSIPVIVVEDQDC